ncbi:MAG: VanW family protein [Lachnospiraceae bacterium]|nr:VanW family protein [Lachnospiraceae bacterium]
MEYTFIKNKANMLFTFVISFLFLMVMFQITVYAKDESITKGITIGDIDVSGMTQEEAMNSAAAYMDSFISQNIELDVDGNKVNVTAGELGYYWKNTDIVEEAALQCSEGNVLERYKQAKDIEKKGLHYEFELDVNDEVMKNTIDDKCGRYNIPHVNAKLTREGNGFTISKESSGRMIDMDKTVSDLHNYLLNDWDGGSVKQVVTVVDDNPVATVADCEKVKDLIGSFTTNFTTGSGNYNRNKNMENGINLLNGITLCQGETMSVNSFLEPWTEDNGWLNAGTYVNGKVEDSLGGGICQVSTTLYNAVLNAELEVVERFNHSMSVGYVKLSMDAALAGTWKDLKIKNNTDTPIYIEGIYNPSGSLTFNIYGVETRPANRRIEYVSETLSTVPSSEIVKQDPSLPAGYRKVTSSGHTGYTARLLKRVYIDGNLESETVVNRSSYSPSPTYVTIGTGAVPEPPTEQVPPAEPQTPEVPAEPQTPAVPAQVSPTQPTPAQGGNSGTQSGSTGTGNSSSGTQQGNSSKPNTSQQGSSSKPNTSQQGVSNKPNTSQSGTGSRPSTAQ